MNFDRLLSFACVMIFMISNLNFYLHHPFLGPIYTGFSTTYCKLLGSSTDLNSFPRSFKAHPSLGSSYPFLAICTTESVSTRGTCSLTAFSASYNFNQTLIVVKLTINILFVIRFIWNFVFLECCTSTSSLLKIIY